MVLKRALIALQSGKFRPSTAPQDFIVSATPALVFMSLCLAPKFIWGSIKKQTLSQTGFSLLFSPGFHPGFFVEPPNSFGDSISPKFIPPVLFIPCHSLLHGLLIESVSE